MTKIRSTDSSNVVDARGSGGDVGGAVKGITGGAVGGIRIPGLAGGITGAPSGAIAAGSMLSVLILLATLFLPRLLSDGAHPAMSDPTSKPGGSGPGCSTEFEKTICGAINDVQNYWAHALPKFFGVQYRKTKSIFYDSSIDSKCDEITHNRGLGYCGAEGVVYLDLETLQTLEKGRVGSTNDLAEQFSIAHEYGHHVQNLLGTFAAKRKRVHSKPELKDAYNIALELQADCYAGVWVRDAKDRGQLESPDEIQEAIAMTEGLGDPPNQPTTKPHGSAEQRTTWFLKGYEKNDPTECNTFQELL